MPIQRSTLSLATKLQERHNRGDFESCRIADLIGNFPCKEKQISLAARAVGGYGNLVDSDNKNRDGDLSFRIAPWDKPLEGDRLMMDYGLSGF